MDKNDVSNITTDEINMVVRVAMANSLLIIREIFPTEAPNGTVYRRVGDVGVK